jgi:hypothetical protein
VYVSDDSGYQVRDDDLHFLSISFDELAAMIDQRVPLGMSAREFEQFRDTLGSAALRDSIDDLDARLQGSSAWFFAGRHKKMAYTRKEIVDDFEHDRTRLPTLVELEQVEGRLRAVWEHPEKRPRRRPFDAYHKLGISHEQSDYDVQISSETLARKAREKVELLGLGDEYDIHHPTYRFIKKSIVFDIAPNLEMWRILQSSILGRMVSIAMFPGDGPEILDEQPDLSCHHRPTDWILMKRTDND